MVYTLITGATGYLGKAFVELCLRRGENVYITGRSEDKLRKLRAQMLRAYPAADIVYFACDLADERSREAMFADAGRYKFSALINVAGADIQKPFCQYNQQKLTFQMRANFEGAVSMCAFCISHAAEHLKIINISSICGQYDMPYFAIYSAAKGALTSFSLALAEELKDSGVDVCVVLPGAIHTRPDVEEYIRTQGLWGKIAAKTPRFVALKALEASERGKRMVIIGAANRALYYLSKFVPARLMRKMIAIKWSRTQKDAF